MLRESCHDPVEVLGLHESLPYIVFRKQVDSGGRCVSILANTQTEGFSQHGEFSVDGCRLNRPTAASSSLGKASLFIAFDLFLIHINGTAAPKRHTQMHQPSFQRAERSPGVDLVFGFEGSEQILEGYALLAGT